MGISRDLDLMGSTRQFFTELMEAPGLFDDTGDVPERDVQVSEGTS